MELEGVHEFPPLTEKLWTVGFSGRDSFLKGLDLVPDLDQGTRAWPHIHECMGRTNWTQLFKIRKANGTWGWEELGGGMLMGEVRGRNVGLITSKYTF